MRIVKEREGINLKSSPVNLTSRSARSDGKCALNAVLIVMVVVSLIITVSAFLSIQKSNRRINAVVAEACNYLQSNSKTPEIEKAGKWFIERLEAISKYSMEASTVSFLVTILSAGIISLGVYLADRGYGNLRDLENKARDLDAKLLEASKKADETARLMVAELKVITERAAITGLISSLVVRSYQISLLLKETSTINMVDSLSPLGRDSLHHLHTILEKAYHQEIEIDHLQHEMLLRQAYDIRDNLEQIPSEFQDQVKDLVGRCNKIIELINRLSPDD